VNDLDELKNSNEAINIGYRKVNSREFIIERSEYVKSLTNENYYAKKCLNKINASNVDVVIVPDLRFKIEFELSKKLNNKVLFIKLNSDLNDCVANTELDDYKFDYYLTNKKNDVNVIKEKVHKFINKEMLCI